MRGRLAIGTATLSLAATVLAGCSGGSATADVAAACAAQGYAPGSEEFRACADAGGAAIATGPGSPYWNADAEEDGGI